MASWIGQDGHDLVGYSPLPGGNGVQDIHIALSNLPAGRAVASSEVQGLGGGLWISGGGPTSWLSDVVRSPGASNADLYIEPYQSDGGRPYNIDLTYDDGSTDSIWVNGGPVDSNLRIASASGKLKWLGQEGNDLTGNGPAVGPDGIQDARIVVWGLSAGATIVSATLTGPGGLVWQAGLNLQGFSNAELVRSGVGSTSADLYFNPPVDLSGKTLTLLLTYADGKTDTAKVVAGPTDPMLRMPGPIPVAVQWNGVSATWQGQDGPSALSTGHAHVAVSGLPAGRSIVSATLSDQAGLAWAFKANGRVNTPVDSNASALNVTRPADPTRADLFFPPARDETGATLTARLLLDDGRTLVTQFPGGSADPSLISPSVAPTAVVAHPGDDLKALVNRYGTVHLSAGTYNLRRPLTLNSPVTIQADPGAMVVFSQAADDAPWTSAIKIHAGHTTLSGFAVRFATTIRWATEVNYGPAVVGTTDNLDSGEHNDPRAGVVITGMDLQAPPSSSSWEEAPRLLRLVTAANGQVLGNTLRGGTTEVIGGPWQIVGNDFRGTVPGSFTYAVFGTHGTHDLLVAGNQTHDVGASGKTWRFLVMTNSGVADRIADNTIRDIGPRDSDTVSSANAPETILTESYRTHFEGIPNAISPNGRVLQIPTPQGDPARTGDLVAILAGPNAGQYFRIAQSIDARTLLMDAPLPAGRYPIAIVPGFLGETFQGNLIDDRGSSVSDGLVLAGNHFGTQVVGNTLLGGDQALNVSATPTEKPVLYGWSHDPMFEIVVANNVLVDSIKGGVLAVDHGPSIKSNSGRVYLTATLRNNVIRWSSAFLGQQAQVGATGFPHSFTIGQPGSNDAGELVVRESGDRMDVPPGSQPGSSVQVQAATINGVALTNAALPLPSGPPPAPPGLALVVDTGTSATDGITADGRIEFLAEPGAVGYESRVGTAGAYAPAPPETPFLPAGLVEGPNTLFVRAYDASGRRGPDATLAIVLETVATPPAAPVPSSSGANHVTNVTSPSFVVGGDPSYVFALAGHAGPATSVMVVLPASTPTGVWLGQDGHDLTGRYRVVAPDRLQDIHVALANLPSGLPIVGAVLKGAGGNEWRLVGDAGINAMALIRGSGSTTADLYFTPYHAERGRIFTLTLQYNDGSSGVGSFPGGRSILGLRMLRIASPNAPVRANHAIAKPGMPRTASHLPNAIVAHDLHRARHSHKVRGSGR